MRTQRTQAPTHLAGPQEEMAPCLVYPDLQWTSTARVSPFQTNSFRILACCSCASFALGHCAQLALGNRVTCVLTVPGVGFSTAVVLQNNHSVSLLPPPCLLLLIVQLLQLCHCRTCRSAFSLLPPGQSSHRACSMISAVLWMSMTKRTQLKLLDQYLPPWCPPSPS
jgi:hypothetical protein